MKKQAFFGLILGSWMMGIFLICIFPPVPDYGVVDHGSGHIGLDSAPEFHLRNTSQTGVFKLPLDNRFLASGFEFLPDPEWRPVGSADLEPVSDPILSFFDVRILFQMFFEVT